MPGQTRQSDALPFAATALLLATVLLEGCNASGQRSGPAGAPPPPVTVMEVQVRDVPIFSDFAAQTYARNTVEVRSRVSESRKTAHSRGDHDRVVPALTGGRQTRNTLPLTSGLNQFPSDVACNVECLSNGPALRNQPGEFIRGCEEQSLWQFLNLYLNRQLHTNRW